MFEKKFCETFSRGGPDGKTGFSFLSISMLCQAFQEIMPLYMIFIYFASVLSFYLTRKRWVDMSQVLLWFVVVRRFQSDFKPLRCVLRERVSYVAWQNQLSSPGYSALFYIFLKETFTFA